MNFNVKKRTIRIWSFYYPSWFPYRMRKICRDFMCQTYDGVPTIALMLALRRSSVKLTVRYK